MDSEGRRVVLVTGGARGIGRAICLALSGIGDHVIVTDIDEIGAHATARAAEALRGTASHRVLDVRYRKDFESCVEAIEREIGEIDVLVNNAGIMPVGAFEEMDEDLERAQFDINVHGVLNGIHAVIPNMRARKKGHIINMASLAGRVPIPYGAIYSAAKFSVVGMTESLRHEYAHTGIHFSTIQPMFVQTDLIAGIATPKWPKPVEAQDVATAVIKTLRRPRARVYVPNVGRVFAILPWLLPDRIGIHLAKRMGAWEVFAEINAQHREGYRERNRSL